MILPLTYFCASARELAPDLLGKLLCRRTETGVLRLRITETECYCGEEDSACHAHRGKTPRNAIMYERGGNAYVYLCYGIHHLLNLTTGDQGHPEAVLIRGVEGIVGPGRVTKALQVDKRLNGLALCEENGIWIEDDGTKLPYTCTARIGIDYAAPEDRERLLRYVAIQETEGQ